MATIIVCHRAQLGATTRNRFSGVDLKDTVNTFKNRVVSDLKKTPAEIDLVYCGQRLKEDASLESCGLHSGSTLLALVKQLESSSTSQGTGEVSNAEVRQLRATLQEAIANPAYRATVENLVTSPDALYDIVNAVPQLDGDPATLTLFQDPELLTVLCHPGNIRRLIDTHPCFPQVAKLVAAAVKEAGSKTENTRSSTRAYSLDPASDDEESAGPSGGQPITANQLAAALAAATSSAASSGGSSSQPLSSQAITTDFFQQAILQAQRSALGSQIQQMREMGITDENVARQALQATNGDLQAALDLIFGGGLP